MKIDRVILAVDNNPKYTIYWNVVSQVWLQKFNIKPTLLFHGTKEEFEKNNFTVEGLDYYVLDPIPEISDPSPNWVIPWSLFWGASKYPEDVCLLSGIDQIPIGNLFFDLINEHNNDKFIIGFSNAYKSYTKETLGYFNTHSNVMYPSSHLVGKGVLFKNIFNVDENYEDELLKVFQNKEKYHLNNKFYSNSKLWGLDECYGSDKINEYPDQEKIIYLDIFWGYWHPRRIDLDSNINVNFNIDMLKEGYYSELTSKDFLGHGSKIQLILNNIKGM